MRTGSHLNGILRAGLLALLVAGAGGVVAVRAQEKSEPQVKRSDDSAQKSGGPGKQLAHETREAAGEEKDETAVFKNSAAVQAVGRLTGMSPQRAFRLCVFTNFAVIGIVIFWAGRKLLPQLFRDRTAAIQKAMQEAQKASEEARRRLAEVESRLTKLDGEIGMMRNAAEREADAEEDRIQAAAEEEAKKIVAAAEQEIAAAAKAARRALTVHAADLAVGLAQKQIHVDASTDQALVRNFAGQLNADGPGKGKN